MTYTPLTLARIAADHMREREIENARLESELLLAAVLGVSRLDLYLQFERPLSDTEVDHFRELVRRRLRREPLQYIVGEAHFRELVLRVDPRVLIPRPESELLVGEVLAWARERVDAGAVEPAGLAAVDIGTGSGAIALSLALEGPFGRVVATDLSAAALAVAAENAERSGLAARVEFREGALWGALAEGERFDVVVSNPPYIAEAERDELAPEVRDWEPEAALFAANAGLEILEALVVGAPDRLHPGGLLALEIGADQGAAVAACVEATGSYGAARVIHDLAGHERMVLAVLAGQ